MPILPVLDLMQGQIVRGIAGRRDEYRPIVSTLVGSAEPLTVARALADVVGSNDFYLADLDAIQRGLPTVEVYSLLQQAGFRLWIDAGIRTNRDATLGALIDADVAAIIVGLETVAGPNEVRSVMKRAGVMRTVFSLDLKMGKPLGQTNLWPKDNAWAIAEHAVAVIGIRRLIVLDLARVGVGEGIGTEDLCTRLKEAYPDVQITAGGGVRGMNDVNRLQEAGVDRILVASALHDGRITAADLRQF